MGHLGMNDRFVSRSGATYPEWLRQAASDFLAGQRDAMPTYTEFLKEFEAEADADGYVTIRALNGPTGEEIPLDEPLRVHVDDLGKLDPSRFGG